MKITIRPTPEDLLTTQRRPCDPRCCLYNLSFLRALLRALKGEVTKVWVDGGHHRFSWKGTSGVRFRWSADTPRFVKNALIALDKWDHKTRKERKAGRPITTPCPITEKDLKSYTITCRRLYKITPATEAQKEAAYARVVKRREEGYKAPVHRRSLHDRVVGYA